MPPSLKARLAGGETLVGTLVTLPSSEIAEIMALVGFDYVWIETEHAPTDLVQAQMMIQAVGNRCPCLVRIVENRESWIKKALDTGCSGIVVPLVMSAAEAKSAVDWCRYPPAGTRSVGIARAHDYGMSFQNYVKKANDEVVVVIQVEHRAAVENIEAILAVPGIDAVFIGPYDLSASFGMPGEISHPQVQRAIDAVKRRCDKVGVPAGIFTTDSRAARRYMEDGFSLIALGLDSIYLWSAAKGALDAVRGPS
ncbi:MAG TPA: aldolase/citrate lyase family protein [Syntrophobacteria bacterium]|nr:aldolase/citrate lyase family protein [Syntrophobacteria bacterium]